MVGIFGLRNIHHQFFVVGSNMEKADGKQMESGLKRERKVTETRYKGFRNWCEEDIEKDIKQNKIKMKYER